MSSLCPKITLKKTMVNRSAEKLVRAEKRNATLLIAHIVEVSDRKLALERGYKSTFDYCVKRLNIPEKRSPSTRKTPSGS